MEGSGEISKQGAGNPDKATLPKPKSPEDALLGTLIGERYRVRELLGRGGMAAVYRGEHELLKRQVAIKVILPQLNADSDMIKRFEREAVAAGKLDHPNCVHITDFGRTKNGRFFLVMEYLDGRALADVLLEVDRFPVERAVHISRQILRGLGRAHELGIVHRDLKAANIMLVDREPGKEVAKIIDFGIAKMMSDANTTHGFKTEAGIVFGTADYLAPERLISAPHIDGRCDLYSVGIIMYEMITGVRPFHAEDAMEIVQKQLKEQPKPMREHAPTVVVPTELEGIVLRALAKDPRDRWPNAKAMLEALDDVRFGGASAAGELRNDTHTPALPSSVPTAVVKLVSAHKKSSEGLIDPTSAPDADGVAQVATMAPIFPVPTPTQAFRARLRRVTFAGWAWLIGAPLSIIILVIILATRGGESKTGEPTRGALPPTPLGSRGSGPGNTEIDELARTAAEGKTLGERQGAFSELVKLGYRDRVDFTAKLSRDLEDETSCEKRREVASQLGRLGDERALPALQEARKKPQNSCLVATADQSIHALGGTPETTKVAVDKPGARPAKAPTTKKKSSGGGSGGSGGNADRF